MKHLPHYITSPHPATRKNQKTAIFGGSVSHLFGLGY